MNTLIVSGLVLALVAGSGVVYIAERPDPCDLEASLPESEPDKADALVQIENVADPTTLALCLFDADGATLHGEQVALATGEEQTYAFVLPGATTHAQLVWSTGTRLDGKVLTGEADLSELACSGGPAFLRFSVSVEGDDGSVRASEPACAVDEEPPKASGHAERSVPHDDEQPSIAHRDVSWFGRLGTQACAPSGPNACMGTGLDGGHKLYDLGPAAVLASASLTLDWVRSVNVQQTLVLSIITYTQEDCGEGTCTYFQGLAATTGQPPFTLETSELDVPEGQRVGLTVSTERLTEPPLYSFVETGEPFHVTGDVVLVPPPAAAQGS